jgi:cysteine desulfurase
MSTEAISREAKVTESGVKLPIYMDNHATTRPDPRVVEAMLPYFGEIFGNAASRNHEFGWVAEEAVERSREQIAKLIGASAKEIVFTSGATESDNLALKGVAEMYREKGNHIITQVTEHKAILDTCKRLEKNGFRVTYLPVQKDGRIDLDDLRRAIDDKTILVSIMAANNEIGVLQPIREIGAICHEKGVIFHTDAVQAVGKVPFNVIADNVDMASISAHKIYGPKGVGALYVRRKNPRVQLVAQMDGGGHERGMRSGTLNVPGIVGLGKACEIATNEMAEEDVRLSALRDSLRDQIMSQLDEVYINGSVEHRLPGNLNISFAFVEGESLLMGINDVAVSSGSACTSATLEPSYVLKALGAGDDLAHSSIRFGIGRFNTQAEVDYVANRVVDVVKRLRELSPLYEMHKEGIDLTKVQWAADAGGH